MRFTHRVRHVSYWLLLVCLIGAGTLRADDSMLGPITKVFAGTIRTMDGKDRVVEAVGVDGRGLIVAVGTRREVVAAVKSSAYEIIELSPGEVLLPGFFDTHLHLSALLTENSGLAALVGPCRPEPYNAGQGNCSNYIEESFERLHDHLADYGPFVVGVNLDPSRQPYNRVTAVDSPMFKQNPAKYIADKVSKSTPVLLIDQSGHFGYANHAAFRALKARLCKGQDPCPSAIWPPNLEDTEGGEWEKMNPCPTPAGGISDDGISCYTGLLREPSGYYAFFPAIGESAFNDLQERPQVYVRGVRKGVLETLEGLRKAGLTTVTNMAADVNEVAAARYMAELKDSGTRVVSIVPPQVAWTVNTEAGKQAQPIAPACDPTTNAFCPKLPRDLGVSGVKVMVDGSTQGCSASLQVPAAYLPKSECKDREGQANYHKWEEIRDALKGLWKKGTWRFEAHANGNHAMDMVLKTFESLQDSPDKNPHVATVIHATVGDNAMWKGAKDLRENKGLDLRFSHLIGHVAYWGAAFERQLGRDTAAKIDATGLDQTFGIPFTLHSDATVSVPRPLWFIRQAVTRETWQYPEMKTVSVLGSGEQISVLEALRAVTIRAAEEKELDKWLGSIQVGKVADFVVLSADPMSFAKNPTKISEIEVIDTYLGGERTKSLLKQ